MFIVQPYLLQTHKILFDALTKAFRALGGIPQRGILDNMTTAVDRIGSGKARQVNARLPHDQPSLVRGGFLQPGLGL
jgi:transposase